MVLQADLVTVLKVRQNKQKDREKEKEKEDEEIPEDAKPAEDEKAAKEEKGGKPAKPLTAKQQKAQALLKPPAANSTASNSTQVGPGLCSDHPCAMSCRAQ